MDEDLIVGNASGGYWNVDSGVDAVGDANNVFALPGNLTFEDLRRQMQYEKNFDPFTEVNAVGTIILVFSSNRVGVEWTEKCKSNKIYILIL